MLLRVFGSCIDRGPAESVLFEMLFQTCQINCFGAWLWDVSFVNARLNHLKTASDGHSKIRCNGPGCPGRFLEYSRQLYPFNIKSLILSSDVITGCKNVMEKPRAGNVIEFKNVRIPVF